MDVMVKRFSAVATATAGLDRNLFSFGCQGRIAASDPKVPPADPDPYPEPTPVPFPDPEDPDPDVVNPHPEPMHALSISK